MSTPNKEGNVKKAKSKQARRIRRTFYLPPEISAWLSERANEDERSVSRYLSNLIRKEMARG